MTPPSGNGPAHRQQVAQADVGERAAHHHLVVAAARAVGVEVARLDAVLDQIPPGRAVALDRARGRDVVGGHAVAEDRQHAGALDVGERLGLGRQALEERRPAHVRRLLVPGEAVAGGHLERVPALVAVEHLAVALAEHVRLHRVLDRLGDLGRGRPDVLQDTPACRGRPRPAARRRGRCPSSRRARRRRTAAARRGSSSSRRG